MVDWHLIPWTYQYLIGGVFAIAISVIVFSRNRESWAYRSFFAYGFCTAAWLTLAFPHRNAPTAELSGFFYRIDLLFAAMSSSFLPITILCIWKKRRAYLWLVLPALVIGMYALYRAPFEILWSNFGWSYRFAGTFGTLFTGMHISYMFLFVGALIYLIRRVDSKSLAKKYTIILIGYPLITVAGMTITNSLIQRNPDFPPFGGILVFTQFLFLAYAVSLTPERISLRSEVKEPISKLSKPYLRFLNAFQAKTPGKELGESRFRFQDYIDAMGLKDIVTLESERLVFDLDKVAEESVKEIPDNILRIMKEHRWAMETMNDFMLVFVRTYDTLQLQSKSRASAWLEQMLQRHGGFLAKNGVLATMPRDARIPGILKDLHGRRGYLLKEEKPEQAYKKLKEALSYGFTALCISKLHPEKVRERYNVGKIPIFWLTFKKAERTISPKDSARLKRTISEFLKTPEASIILFDCFDQIKAANGFQKSLTILEELMSLRGSDNSIMLMSVNPHMFEEGQLEAVEKELEEAKTERA